MRAQKILIFLIPVIILACSAAKDTVEKEPDSKVHLYLLAGQSNMAGRGYIDSQSKIPDPRILVLTKNNEWLPATDPLHFDKKEAGVGPGISFAQAMLKIEANSNVKIGLIPCAVGGTSIDAWQPGAYDQATGTHPYDDAIKRLNAAQGAGIVKGIIWHQGESDSSPDKRKTYINKLAGLVERLRTELKQPNLPFIAGELGYFSESKRLFNSMLKDLPQQVNHTSVVSAEGLTANPDNLHFNTTSARELGNRYAQAMELLLK